MDNGYKNYFYILNYFFRCDTLFIVIYKKEGIKMKQHDKGKIATKIMAGILAALMLLGTVGTLLYYIFA